MGGVALRDRHPRITRGEAIGFRLGEVDLLAGRVAPVVRPGWVGTKSPTSVASQRRGDLGETDASDVISVAVSLGHEHRIRRTQELRRQDRQDALIELRSKVEQIARVQATVVRHARNVGEAHTVLR